MKNELKALYDEYDCIQRDDPIPIGQLLHGRICDHLYKEKTMKQVVGLLKEFISDYEREECQRNTRYTVKFTFGSFDMAAKKEGKIGGPFLTVLDFVDEKCVCVMCWNAGNIQKFYKDDVSTDAWCFDYCDGVATLRKRHGLPNTLLWKPLGIEIHDGSLLLTQYFSQMLMPVEAYDIPWNEIDKTGCLSPIQGIDAVAIKQIAEYLCVSVTYVLDCMRDGYKESCFRNGQVGIAYVDADEAVRKISGAIRDSLGATLPLENGETIHVANSKTQYFSRYAAAWIIHIIENREDFVKHQAITRIQIQKKQEKWQDEHIDVTWDKLCSDGRLSPIKGLDIVSKRQAADYLGISEPELQRYIVRFKSTLEKLGMFVTSPKNLVKNADNVRRNKDYSYEVLLKNGDWTHIPTGKYTFFTAFALGMVSNVIQKEKERC